MPRATLGELDWDNMTPFAQIIYTYLLSFRPTKLVADLARETGISDQAIWRWLRDGTLPRRGTIMDLHRGTGIPLEELLHAAGLLTVEEALARRRENQRVVHLMVEQMKASAMSNPHFTADEQRAVLEWLEKLPEEFLAGADIQRAIAQALSASASESESESTEAPGISGISGISGASGASEPTADQSSGRLSSRPSDGPAVGSSRFS